VLSHSQIQYLPYVPILFFVKPQEFAQNVVLKQIREQLINIFDDHQSENMPKEHPQRTAAHQNEQSKEKYRHN
jgi:hypothetical protein